MPRLFFILILIPALSGCGPTYPKEKLPESIVRLCKKEYGVDVEAKVKGKTCGVYVPIEGMLDATLAPTGWAVEIVSNVTLITGRVTLSSDAELDFCTIVAVDPNAPAFEWRLTRHITDVKRAYLGAISRGEYFKRMDMAVEFNPQALLGEKKEEFDFEEVRLPEFLAKQMTRKIQTQFAENIHLARRFEVKAVKGEFKVIEAYTRRAASGQFRFTVDIVEKEEILPGEKMPSERLINLVILKTALDVSRKYGFEDYDVVNIVNTDTGRSLTVDKMALQAYRRERIPTK